MNQTDKLEMQVEELQDGGASVALPEGEDNPQTEDKELNADSNENSNDNDDSDDEDHQNESAENKLSRTEERRLQRQARQNKKKESYSLINSLKRQNTELAR
jgi:hypothetical protein